jgi:hypothetical protein
MKTVFAVLGVLIAVCPTTAHGKKLPPPSKLNLVQAQCPGHPPGPCSPSFAFTSGTAILVGQKEPTPACHDPERAKGGEVRLAGVTKDGAAFSGTLLAQAELQTTFERTPTTATAPRTCNRVPSLSGELTCRTEAQGRCERRLPGPAPTRHHDRVTPPSSRRRGTVAATGRRPPARGCAL